MNEASWLVVVNRKRVDDDPTTPAEARACRLVVDDDHRLRSTACAVRESAGFSELSAIDARDALDTVGEHGGRTDVPSFGSAAHERMCGARGHAGVSPMPPCFAQPFDPDAVVPSAQRWFTERLAVSHSRAPVEDGCLSSHGA